MVRRMDAKSALDRAVEAAGGEDAFLVKLGVRRRTLMYWRAGKRLFAERVIEIEELTGVPRHDLRPDLWPPPADKQAAA
jgi:DNA-binding transcriptional regulator YdaS (Cro superfamily)